MFQIVRCSFFILLYTLFFLKGSSESIHCQADATLDFCKWQKDDFTCRVLTEEQTECGVFTASLEGDKCSLTFDEGATRDDVGSYTCLLVQGKDIIEGMILKLKGFSCRL